MDFPLEEIRFSLQLFNTFKDEIKNIANRIVNKYSEFKEEQDEPDTERDECIWKTLNMIVSESEIKKSERIERFAEKTIMDPNCDLDNSTILCLLSNIEEISWRQLCFIEGFQQNSSRSIEINDLSNSGSGLSGLNSSTRFTEIKHLKDLGCLGFSDNLLNYNNVNPNDIRITPYGKLLSELMELNTIPPEEINKAFTIWGIKRVHR